MEWWKALGFKENPLDIKPNPNVLGLEEEESKIVNSLVSGIPIHVYGEIGTGKTSLAKKISLRLGKKYKIIYLNGEEDPNPDIEKEIKKNYGFFDRIRKRKIIVLLDESQRFSEDFMRKIKYLFDEGRIYSFATFQIEKTLKNVPSSMLDRFNLESIELKSPPEEIVKEIVKIRLKGKVKIDERGLEVIIRRNRRNVRGVLKTLLHIFSVLGPKKELTYEDIMNNLPPTLETKEEKIRLSNQQKLLARSLLEGPKTIKELEEELNIRKETIAKQLSRMLEKGYLIKRRDGKNVYYELKEDVKRILTTE